MRIGSLRVFLVLPILTGFLLPAFAGTSKDVEDLSKRDMVSRHFRRPDGSWRAEICAGPVHYQDSRGNWLPIDTTLAQVPGRSGELANTANILQSGFTPEWIRIASRGNELLRFSPRGLFAVSEDGTRSFVSGFSPKGFSGKGPVDYAGVWGPGTRSSFRIQPGAVKEYIILEKRLGASGSEAPAFFDFVSYVENTRGLVLRAQGSEIRKPTLTGSPLEFLDSAGKPVCYCPRPEAWDGSIENHDPAGGSLTLAYFIEPAPGGWNISVRVPGSWMLDPGRKLPIVVDPTFTGMVASGNCGYLCANGTTRNNGLFCTGSYLSYGDFACWCWWDITSIPDAATISQVDVRFYSEAVETSTSVPLRLYDHNGSTFGFYSTWSSTVYNDLKSGNVYHTFNVSGIGYYPSSTTYYTLTTQANTDLQGRLGVNKFQIGVYNSTANQYKRFYDTTRYPAIQVTYSQGPPVPASITVPASSTTGSFTVSWSSSTGATSYDLEEDTTSAFSSPTQVYTGASTSFGVTNKPAGTYWYRVRASNTAGTSAWRTSTNGCVVQIPPAAPSSITVPANSVTGNYAVSWSSSIGATGYDLEEATDAAFSSPTTVYQGANTTYNVTGKVSGTFYYRVRATNTWGNSGWTAGANGCQIIPPNPPASITVPATSVTGTYTVTWTAETGATGYDLQEDSSASFTNPTVVYSGTNTSFLVTGKTAGTFYYRVRATNGAGQSAWTAGANGCQIVAPAPPVPLTVPASSTTGTYTVTWGASTGAVSYELQEDTSSGFGNPSTVAQGVNLSYTAIGKWNGTYYYRVRASNGAGASAWTLDLVGCTVALSAPGSPGSITVPVMSSTGNFVVSWTAVTGATGYDLEEDSSPAFTGAVQVYTGASTQFGVTGKTNGVYYYRVRATNAAGVSGWTNGGNGCTVTLSVPLAPTSLTVPSNSFTGNFGLTWTSVSGNPSYELVESTNAGFTSPACVYLGPGTSFQVTGRTDGTYWYRVRTVNTIGNSGWTDGSNPCLVSLATPALSVFAGCANPWPTQELPGASGVRMLHVRLGAGAHENIRLLNLQVNSSGSGDDSTEIVQVFLWRDVDGDGFARPGDFVVAADSFAADDGSVSFDLSAEPVLLAGGVIHYLVVCDLATSAVAGSGFTFQVNIPAGLVCQGASSFGPVVPTGSAVVGGAKTIANSGVGSLALSMGPNSPASGTVTFPSSDAPMLQVILSASSIEGVGITRMLFTGFGGGDETKSITAKLYLDGDGDGLVSSGSTPLGTGTYGRDNGSVEFTGLALTVPAGVAVTLILAYDLGDGCLEGDYRASLAVDADVTASGETTHMGINAKGAPLNGAIQVFSADSGRAVYFMGGCASGGHSPTGWAGYLLLLGACLAIGALRRRARHGTEARPGVWRDGTHVKT